jgi:amino acid permease
VILRDHSERKSLDVRSKFDRLEEIHSPVKSSTLESSCFSISHLTELEKEKRTSSTMYTLANIGKLYLGIAFLGLPKGFISVGLFPAISGLIWILLLNIFTTYLLIKARNKYRMDSIASLSDLAEKTLGPEARAPTDLLIMITQASFLVAYDIYAGE